MSTSVLTSNAPQFEFVFSSQLDCKVFAQSSLSQCDNEHLSVIIHGQLYYKNEPYSAANIAELYDNGANAAIFRTKWLFLVAYCR